MDSTCRCIHIDQNSSVCVMLMLYKCLRRGKPQLWLMLCIVCKRQNIQRVMAIAMLVWELAETIMLYNDNNSMLGNDQHIQNHLLKYRTLDSSLCEETSGWLCSIPMLLPLTGEETPRDLLSVHWGLLYQKVIFFTAVPWLSFCIHLLQTCEDEQSPLTAIWERKTWSKAGANLKHFFPQKQSFSVHHHLRWLLWWFLDTLHRAESLTI